MDSILADQLEWLISGNMEGLRFKRQLLLLAGCLADGEMPSQLEAQIAKLTQRIAREEVFSALLETLNAYLRQAKDKDAAPLDVSGLVAQVEASRQELNQCEPANIALIVTWLLSRARDRKLISKLRASR
jgi:hypothetical protein